MSTISYADLLVLPGIRDYLDRVEARLTDDVAWVGGSTSATAAATLSAGGKRLRPRQPGGTILPVQRDVAVVGAGYVGLPLAVRLAEAGRTVVCLDPDATKMERLNAGDSYIEDVSSEELARLVSAGQLSGTTDETELRDADAILICVPTPLAEHREPDLSAVRSATAAVARNLRKNHVVILESRRTAWVRSRSPLTAIGERRPSARSKTSRLASGSTNGIAP